jgi:hypothetical protein
MAQDEATRQAAIGRAGCVASVGGSCPQVAEEAETHDGGDRQDEEFHDGSFLAPAVVAVLDSPPPSACSRSLQLK